MKITHRRIALFTGASVAALAATPAFADPYYPTPAPHDTVAPGTYAGTAVIDNTDPVASTIVICNIATASPECFLGVKAEGPGTQSATVNSPATGQIVQTGNSAAGPVDLNVINAAGDTAEIGAVAFATAPTLGVANASAHLDSAIDQSGQGGDLVTVSLENDGTLIIDALAVATGTNAQANAHIDDGITQYASSTGGSAIATVINDGTLQIGATAIANGVTNASANAYMHTGITQSANAYGGGDAVAGVTNNVNLHINAFASAAATSGAANAYASASGINQSAYAAGGGDAIASVVNAGNLEIHATAIANGTSYASASASASGISQSATALNGGNATNIVSNAALGVIDIAAVASATATGVTGNAYASAEASSGIEQSANAYAGGTASNMIANAGTLTVRAEALANGATFASASASNSSAIEQRAYATGGGDAINTVDNGGTLSITAVATANANDGNASADASISSAISQSATVYDGGDATSLIANDGTLTIDAIANADAANGGNANAYASNVDAIEQSATAFEGGDAFASITGVGTINIGATAVADAATVVVGAGTTAVTLPGGHADAFATVYNAISQHAFASPLTGAANGNATANISQGSINITALAMADGDSADATAQNNYGIEQYARANGGGDALALISLGGGSIDATATAMGTDGSAAAYASVYYAISQTADADMGGDATVSLANTGAMTINAIANATAESFAAAAAYNSNAIYQTAQASGQVDIDPGVGVTLVGGDASVTIDNSGDLEISAVAAADGSAANAYARVSDAISQNASAFGTGTAPVGGNATADIVNDGTIAIDAVANAQATDGGAVASAFNNSDAIEQNVHAYDGGDATVSITGAGSIDIGALATAVSTDNQARALASVQTGISQHAFAELGDAAAIISQAGGININATALAGGSSAQATANVEYGIYQSANAADGDATASLTLGGDSNIVAIASANATDKSGAANASVVNAISQYAFAGGGNDATISLNTTGTLTIGASAVAVADETASANAFVDGLYQSAMAGGGGDASITAVNGADFVVLANATATGATARADAEVSYGWYQYASTYGTGTDPQGGDATISLTNTGSITVGANAVADATAGDASAHASVETGVVQAAQAFNNGDASVTLDNAGALTVFASASADAGNRIVGIGATATTVYGDAFASASVHTGVYQFASGLNGTASLDNGGTIDITASAVAGGGGDAGVQTTFAPSTATTVTFAIPGAQAHIDNGIVQFAQGNMGTAVVGVGATATTVAVAGDALASLTNDGTINVNADASATGTGLALAGAVVDTGIAQFATADGGDAMASMVNGGTVAIAATANANGATAMGTFAVMTAGGTPTASDVPGAFALVSTGILQVATANPVATAFDTVNISTGTVPNIVTFPTAALVGNASVTLDNSGAITVDASANATATGQAYASANVDAGIRQFASADTIVLGFGTTAETVGGDASATLTNSGSVAVGAVANASGSGAVAAASATGIFQNVIAGAGMASASFTNSGTVTVSGNANAVGSTMASASAAGSGVYQSAAGSTVLLTADNSGSIAVSAAATASADSGPALANAAAANGIAQVGFGGDIVETITNSGTVALVADALATGAGTASASAFAGSALWQLAIGDTADLSMVNSGTATATANAVAVANGTVIGAGTTATTAGSAFASAQAYGLGQIALADTGTATMVNSGVLNVGAHATASGFTAAVASASATGAYQTVNGAIDLAFTNSGAINVNASAIAGGVATGTATDADITPATGSAYANAVGYYGYASGGDALDVTIVNSGTMSVSATAIAPMTAEANAQGIILENAPTTTTVGTGTTAVVTVTGNPIDGTLTNSGTLNVVASASGGTTVVGTGATATTVAMSSANATGILIMSGANNMVVTNSGTITVDAITANGGNAEANGVLVEGNGDVAFSADNQFTFTNDGGTIIVRESDDGGASWRRGTAIDVSQAPNYSVINLLGDGEIYGNIDVAEGDDIFVEAGDTYFDGIVNPECSANYGGPGPAYDDPAVNACGQGTLTIQNGGNLILANSPFGGDETMYDGPSYVFVDTFNVGAEGTITFQLSPENGGVQPIGSYPQVFADVANLDGTLVAEFTNTNESGLFEDSYFFNNVIDAEERNGQFDQCLITGINTDSPLLEFSGCIYDDMQNVDLGLERVAFDAVAGLTGNQGSVAGGIECLYDDIGPAGLAGTAFGDLVGELFLFDGTEYPQALEQLTGAGFAGYLQSFNTLGYRYNQILDRATDCEIPALAGSALACRVAPVNLWGQIDYDTLSQDGDRELGSYDADRWSFLIGGDVSVTPASVIGVSVGKVTNKVNYDATDTRIKGDGWQFGLYGTYDPGQFYVKALGTYTKMDGDSRRSIDFTPFGGTLNGQMEGDPDVRMWTFGLHGGYRIPLGPTSVVTPFLNYDYTDAKLKGFTETGVPGANLTVNGGREKHSWLTGGVKWAGQLGGLVPEASVGYRYMFGDRRASFNANFDGFEGNCDFDIVSMTEKRGALLAGISIGGKLGMVDVRVGYNGAFNSDMRENSGFLKLVVPLGAVAAPPPPPMVIAPPPPPPAPATQTCPDGSVILATDICPAPPPPPPPPAPAPERG